MSNPLFILIIIIGGILVFLQNRKKYSLHFYENLSIKQLYFELVGIVNSILEQQKQNSNYKFSGFKDYDDFYQKMMILKHELKANNPNSIQSLNNYFGFNGNFKQLARSNNWNIEYDKLYERFHLIYQTIENMEN